MALTITDGNITDIYLVLNALPTPMAIIKDNKVVFANEASIKLRSHIEGEYLDQFLGSASGYAKERLKRILYHNEKSIPSEYILKSNTGDHIHIEVTAHPIQYKDGIAILAIAQDITQRNKELYDAAVDQQNKFHRNLPKINNLLTDSVYVPAKYIGGDFYYFHPLSDTEVVGVIGDVTGKGPKAAMHISAFEMLFHEIASQGESIETIAQKINERFIAYYPDNYIAALFFHINHGIVSLCSCGINHYALINEDDIYEKKQLKGPFLGMLPSTKVNPFQSITLSRSNLKQLFLYSDGLEANACCEDLLAMRTSITEKTNHIKNRISALKNQTGFLADDFSLLAFDLDFTGMTYQTSLYGIASMNSMTQHLTELMPSSTDFSYVKLILTELITNAYKFGNNSKDTLPIDIELIINGSLLTIKVTDMAISKKDLTIPTTLEPLESLVDSGRGLYLINMYSQRLYYNDHTIIIEYTLGGH